MKELQGIATPLFYGLLVELLSLLVTYLTKNNPRVAMVIFLLGTALAGSIAFAPTFFVPTLAEEISAPEATPSLLSPSLEKSPSVIENFDDSSFDGSFNPDIWFYRTLEYKQIAQQNGILTITCGPNPDCGTGLKAKDYNLISFPTLTSSAGLYFEARLKLSPEANNGNVHLQIYSDNGSNGQWWTQCSISNSGQQEQVACNLTQPSHVSSGKFDEYGTWHLYRIQVDSSKMTFNYYIDGNLIDTVPIPTENLKNASFSFHVGVHGSNVTGYVDDVQIGQVSPQK